MALKSIVILALVAMARAEEESKVFKRQVAAEATEEYVQEESAPRSSVVNTFSNAPDTFSNAPSTFSNAPNTLTNAASDVQYRQSNQQVGSPQFLSRQFNQRPLVGQSPISQGFVQRQRPVAQNTFQYNPALVERYVNSKPANSELLSASVAKQPILARLPSNATLIRPDIDDSFDCEGRKYGYYADVKNDCQLFHVCVPLKEVHQNDKDVARVPDVTYHFSFICNFQTYFSQDSLTCARYNEGLPCSEAEAYVAAVDYQWFKVPEKKGDTAGAPGYGRK